MTQLRNLMMSAGLALVLAAPTFALAANPEKDTDFAMALAKECDVDNKGMVTKANFMKMMEQKWDKHARGAKEMSVASTARIFMDGYRATN